MRIDNKFEAIDRIIACIDMYQLQIDANNDLFTSEQIDDHLKQQLTKGDYLVWRHTRMEIESMVVPSISVIETALALATFEQCLGRYKRLVYEQSCPLKTGEVGH